VRDLRDEPDILVVGGAATAGQALARGVPAVRPQAAVLDVRLPAGLGGVVSRRRSSPARSRTRRAANAAERAAADGAGDHGAGHRIAWADAQRSRSLPLRHAVA
jgi:hypothetical protein